MDSVAFYQNWVFWQWVVSLAALITALIPPISRLVKGPKLSLDFNDRLHITNTMGNPNLTMFLMLRNIGGKPLRIQSMELEVRPEDADPFKVPAKNYYPSQTDSQQAILAPYKLEPDEDWTHSVLFFNPFSRADERLFRELLDGLKGDINKKKVVQPGQVAGSPKFVKPLENFFNEKFKWFPKEYELRLTITTEPVSKSINKSFRITLYEWESEELKSYAKSIKYGLGVYYFDYEQQPGIWVPIVRKENNR